MQPITILMLSIHTISVPDSIPRRVHIAPQGFEDERIYIPAIDRDADILVLVGHDEPDETAVQCRERIVDALNEQGIEVQETATCNLFDLNNSLETLLTLIRDRNPEDTVRVNISAGSKITAIAGMLACMFTDADPYYVVPEEQPNDGPYGVLLKDIGRYLLEQDLPAVHGSNKSPDDAEDIYPTVNEKIVSPLHQRRLISKTRLDGGTQIRTTQEGKEMLALAESLTGE